jgi:phospholipid-binding lipoprotein MlaA
MAVLCTVRKSSLFLLCSFTFSLIGGCAAINQGDFAAHEKFEKTNRASFRVSERIDKWVFRPISKGYSVVVPEPAQAGVTNFFNNVRDIDSSLNGFLQGDAKSGGGDLARVVINSTLGVVGLFDVAASFDLESSEEDFGQTLARWGYTESTYLYLPVLGPSTVRDLPGQIWQRILSANFIFGSFATTAKVTDGVSSRANVLEQTDARDDIALDAFAFTRNAYYQSRKNQIFNGMPPEEDFFDLLDESYDESHASLEAFNETSVMDHEAQSARAVN